MCPATATVVSGVPSTTEVRCRSEGMDSKRPIFWVTMKTDKLFVVFLAVLLVTCILQIYMTSSYVSITAVPTEYQPLMKVTHHTVQNNFHLDLSSNCSNMTLPLTEHSPLECWPRLIILPSHATSGSKLFQDIWEPFGRSMSQYYESPHKVDKLFTLDSLSIYGSLNASSILTYAQQPIIFKSHISQSKKSSRRQEMKTLLQYATDFGVLHGIIRMARNPGDQLLRNRFRWSKQHTYCKNNRDDHKSEFDCFLKMSKKLCPWFGFGEQIKAFYCCIAFVYLVVRFILSRTRLNSCHRREYIHYISPFLE